MFSARTSWPLSPNRWHRLAGARREQGDLLDLTITNPTACGFDYPSHEILDALAQPASLGYEPNPKGLASTRAVVSAYYAERGVSLEPERLILTAGTSEAYAHLFRLLCDAGDEVLMPAPSYPLFEMLAGLNDVGLVSVPMLYDQGWHLDLHALAAAAGPRTRALLLVHPNNPAGNYLKPNEWQAVQTLAAERGWAVVLDEVFFDYAIPPGLPAALDLAAPPALTLVLNGLSKLAALPQLKLGWIAVLGPEGLVAAALSRLEHINDLFLSVDAPVQHAAARLFATRHQIQGQILQRLQANLATLDGLARSYPALERLPVEGGWSALLRLPNWHSDEAWAELLIERAGVLVHPGHFYGMTAEGHVVVSLLTRAETLGAAVERMRVMLATNGT